MIGTLVLIGCVVASMLVLASARGLNKLLGGARRGLAGSAGGGFRWLRRR